MNTARCSNYFGIYDRHRGPFTLVLTRETPKKVRGAETIALSTDRVRGPFNAEDAHETARLLVTDPRDNVRDAFVYSESEGQFIGAFYQKDAAIPSWDDVSAVPLASTEQAAVTAPVAAPVVTVVAPTTPKPERRPRGAQLVVGKADRWPTSKGAQIVRQFFHPGRRATAQEIVGAVGEQLKAAGIEFPGSLVSRLKQGGFLTEAA